MRAPQKVAEEETKIVANYAFLQPRSQGGDESEAAFVIFCINYKCVFKSYLLSLS